ncbi:MAG: M20/M25/M40 family metallo-hydrolase [Synergistaceae bacterium]|nr:M20/M25/M40 family metallo-hydrolase [Synergistaceae bacterium]
MKFKKLFFVVFVFALLISISAAVAIVPEHANPLKKGVNDRSFMVDNYSKEVSDRIEALRPRLIGDAQGLAKIDSYTGNYDDRGYIWPSPGGTAVVKYLTGIAQELGLRTRIVTPSSTNPPVPVYATNNNVADPNGAAYAIIEIGPEDAVESIGILSHMDTIHDGMRIDYESSIGVVDMNKTAGKLWNLGGILSGKEIIDPVTGRTAIMGRGLDDDKGPAIPEIYALKAIQDSGVPLKRKIWIVLGTDEEGGQGFQCMSAFSRLEHLPKLSFCPDAAEATMRLTENVMWYARGFISWDNPGNDNITLRFPGVLEREEYALSNNTAANGPGTFARWKATYNAYHVGSLVGTNTPTGFGNGWGLQLKTAAWLVCDEEVTAGLLYADAMKIREAYIDKYWTYLQTFNYYPPFITKPKTIDDGPPNPRLNPDGTPEYGRWDVGIDVQLVKSNPDKPFQDTVQIITRGINWRFTEQQGTNSRQILVDFLANLTMPNGATARWHEAIKRINKVFPYGEASPGKETYRAAHLFDTVGVLAHFNEITPSLTTNVGNRNMSIPGASWDLDVAYNLANPTRPGARTVNYVGQNTEDVGQLYFELRFLYPMVPYDDEWFLPSTEQTNLDYFPTVQARKVRAAMAAAGIGSSDIDPGVAAGRNQSVAVTSGGFFSYNQASGGSGINSTTAFAVPNYYTSYVHDSTQFGLRASNAFFREQGIPYRDTLCGQNGGNYSRIFRPGNVNNTNGNASSRTAPPIAGTVVGVGSWGGKVGYHAYNERIEPDGFIAYANKIAMMVGDAAQGRYHTYDVRGNGNTQPRMVFRLENVQTLPTYAELGGAPSSTTTNPNVNTWDYKLKEDVYISEFNELPGIMAELEAKGVLPVDPETNVDFLFGRKFLMKGIPANGALELSVKVDGPEKGQKQHLVVAGELADGSGWDVVNNNAADKLETLAKVATGSKFDKAVASDDVVNTRLVAFLVTEPDTGGSDDDDCKDQIKNWLEELCEEGCNAGIPMLGVLALVAIILRRKF